MPASVHPTRRGASLVRALILLVLLSVAGCLLLGSDEEEDRAPARGPDSGSSGFGGPDGPDGPEDPVGGAIFTEYLLVEYPVERDVLVNGLTLGKTGQVLSVEPGYCVVELEGAQDYTPIKHEPEVGDTSAITPMVVSFTPQAGGGDGE